MFWRNGKKLLAATGLVLACRDLIWGTSTLNLFESRADLKINRLQLVSRSAVEFWDSFRSCSNQPIRFPKNLIQFPLDILIETFIILQIYQRHCSCDRTQEGEGRPGPAIGLDGSPHSQILQPVFLFTAPQSYCTVKGIRPKLWQEENQTSCQHQQQ